MLLGLLGDALESGFQTKKIPQPGIPDYLMFCEVLSIRGEKFSQRYDILSLWWLVVFGTSHRFKDYRIPFIFCFPSLLRYQRFTSSTTGTRGLNCPLPPPKGDQIRVSRSGWMSKANGLTHSIIHVVLIVSFERPAAVSFIALNVWGFFLPEVPLSTISQFLQVPSQVDQILHFHT